MCGALSSLPVKAEKKLVREFRKPRIETGDFLRQAGVESGESNPATMPLKPKSPSPAGLCLWWATTWQLLVCTQHAALQ